MNGARVVPILLALWLPFTMPERTRRAWHRLRRVLGLVHEPEPTLARLGLGLVLREPSGAETELYALTSLSGGIADIVEIDALKPGTTLVLRVMALGGAS